MMGFEEVNQARKSEAFVDREVKGLGTVRIRRMSAGEFFDFDPDANTTSEIVLASVCKADGTPLFASMRDLRTIDLGVFRALSVAAIEVNSLDLVAAKKC